MHVQPIREAVLSAIELSVRSALPIGSGNGLFTVYKYVLSYSMIDAVVL